MVKNKFNLPKSNEEIGIFLEDLKRAGVQKPLATAMRILKKRYKEEKNPDYLDTFYRLVLVKRLLKCYNIYNKTKYRDGEKTIRSLLKSYGVL